MSAAEHDFNTWQSEQVESLTATIAPDVGEILKLEKDERRIVFNRLDGELTRLLVPEAPSAFFIAYPEGIVSRSVLVIPENNRHRGSNIMRIIINDEINRADFSRREKRAEEYVLQRVGRLIISKTATMPMRADGSWDIGKRGFLVQKRDDNPARVFHGSGYFRERPQDVPDATPIELIERREKAQRLLTVLQGLGVPEGRPQDGYCFHVVAP
ncbi:MAG TPA: hypothetical protein VFI84_04330 [Candidatus Saccharimonadales bacterium]|nr:hypothetical protein [Candidatus Saccharimonadales bacterium]